jgi:hypothetical protein
VGVYELMLAKTAKGEVLEQQIIYSGSNDFDGEKVARSTPEILRRVAMLKQTNMP